jgi:transcription initiation factor TFIIIB Brf1 subunit/transcription initiation factor TFIIB
MAESGGDETYENRLFEVAERLQVPDSTLQITRVRLDRLGGDADIEEGQLDSIAPAVLALSCREDGLPLSDQRIVEAWLDVLDEDIEAGSVDVDRLPEQIEAVADRLDIDHPPARPDRLLDRYAEAFDTAEALVAVAHRILADAYEESPRAVAEASSPSETAAAALVLAAEINNVDGYGPSDVADVGAAGGVTIKNRFKAFRDALGENTLLSDERYRVEAVDADAESGDTGTEPTATEPGEDQAPIANAESAEPDEEDASTAATETDAAAEPDETAETTEPDESARTDEGAETVDADEASEGARATETDGEGTPETEGGAQASVERIQQEVDALTEAVDVDASQRLFARGLVSEAADDVTVEAESEFAGAALIASSRLNDGDLDPSTVAAEREFEPRALYQWIDRLEETTDVDIPRRSATDVVEDLVAELDLSEAVHEESRRTIEQYRPADDGSFAAPELAAGAVFFAATTVREPVDVDELAEAIGFEPANVSDAMNSVFVSLCRDLLRGEIEYDECGWTDELLESDQIAAIGDPHTGRVVAAAKTYIAGREGDVVDDGTLDVLLAED